MPAAAAMAPGSLCHQAGPRVPTAHRLYSPMTVAVPVAPGSWYSFVSVFIKVIGLQFCFLVTFLFDFGMSVMLAS
jgi:hypothetical protein